MAVRPLLPGCLPRNRRTACTKARNPSTAALWRYYADLAGAAIAPFLAWRHYAEATRLERQSAAGQCPSVVSVPVGPVTRVAMRYVHSLSPLAPSQWALKPYSVAKLRLLALCPRIANALYRAPAALSRPSQIPVVEGLASIDGTALVAAAERSAEGQFSFLGLVRRYGTRVDWDCPDVPRLWRFHLHYLGHLVVLGLAHSLCPERGFYGSFRGHTRQWLDGNPIGRGDAWHPYTVSLRVPNWLAALRLFAPDLYGDASFRAETVRALCSHCRFLAGNLETEARGNHLLANVRALLLASEALPDPHAPRWRSVAMKHLKVILARHVLADGGHYERAPGYHLLVMQHLVECLLAIEQGGNYAPGLVARLRDALPRMADFATALKEPDGRFPLLNDSAYDACPSVDEAVGLARWAIDRTVQPPATPLTWLISRGAAGRAPVVPSAPPQAELRQSGYYLARDTGGSSLLVDCGDVCPDELPAHAHADTLGIGIWSRGVPIVNDSGTYEYTAGPWRQFFRSTRAHSTVVVDDQDSSEVWASFRVARRARAGPVVWVSGPAFTYFRGSHDGYRRLREPVRHVRRVLWLKGVVWAVVDLLVGRGVHRADSWLHLAPGAVAMPCGAGTMQLSCGSEQLLLQMLEGDSMGVAQGEEEPAQGWRSEVFGIKVPRPSISMRRQGPVPYRMAYALWQSPTGPVSLSFQLEPVERYVIARGDKRWAVDVDAAAPAVRVEVLS